MRTWTNNIAELKGILDSLSVCDNLGKEVESEKAFLTWKNITEEARSNRNAIFLIGNGASASMASHISADLAKNAHLHTEVFTDLSLITAIANDISYDEVYAEPLRRRIKQNDILIAISSSGCSPNILRAAEEAKNLNGYVVTLSAMKPDNPLRRLGLINFYIPAKTYGLAETGHATILHFWVDMMTII